MSSPAFPGEPAQAIAATAASLAQALGPTAAQAWLLSAVVDLAVDAHRGLTAEPDPLRRRVRLVGHAERCQLYLAELLRQLGAAP